MWLLLENEYQFRKYSDIEGHSLIDWEFYVHIYFVGSTVIILGSYKENRKTANFKSVIGS